MSDEAVTDMIREAGDEIERLLHEIHTHCASGNFSAAAHAIERGNQVVESLRRWSPGFDGTETIEHTWATALFDMARLYATDEFLSAIFPSLRDLARRKHQYRVGFDQLSQLHVLHGSRARHLAMWHARAGALNDDSGSLMLVSGVAGIGKSSFAQACSNWAAQRNAITIKGRCYERGVMLPFSPWREALEMLAQAIGVGTDHLPAPFGEQPAVDSVESLVHRVGTYLLDLTTQHAIVLVLDDLQWADQETLSLLEYVTRRIEHHALVILGTYRSEEITRDHLLQPFLLSLQRDRPTDIVQLTPLTRNDTARFIEGRLGPCRRRLVDYLYERSEGHPLFLVELTDDLIEQDLLLQSDNGHWLAPDRNLPIPSLLSQLLQQRVARLGTRCEEMLNVAAVAGEVWPLAVVEQILGWPEEELLTEIDRAVETGAIAQDDLRGERYRFEHGLIWEVVYERQNPRRRRQMHLQIATLLEQNKALNLGWGLISEERPVAELAYHFLQAEKWPEAFHYSRAAGIEANRLNAMPSVVHYHRQAMIAQEHCSDLIPPEQLLDPLEQLGYAYILLSRREEALAVYHRMLEVAKRIEDQVQVAHALLRLAEAQERIYDHEQSAQTRRAALSLVKESEASDLMMRYHFTVGHHHLVAGGIERSTYHLQQLAEYAEQEGQEQFLIDARRYLAYLAVFQGKYRRAIDQIRPVTAIAKETSNASLLVIAYWMQGFALTEIGAFEQARHSLLRGLALRETVGDRHFYIARIRNSLGNLHRELGDLENAKRWNRESLDMNLEREGHRAIECACYSYLDLAASCLDAGEVEESAAHLQQYAAIADGNQYAGYRPLNRSQLLQAELALAQEAYTEALGHAERALELAEAETMRKNITKGLLLKGRILIGLGDVVEATDSLQQAVALADEIDHATLRWQTRLRLGDAHALAGESAQQQYHEASTLVNEIAQRINDADLRRTFLQSSQIVELQEKARSDAPVESLTGPAGEAQPTSLSHREVEVLQLIAQGLTDRLIAARLQISVRTVNTHVANILNKTGCQNRAAAVAFAAQRGLLDSSP